MSGLFWKLSDRKIFKELLTGNCGCHCFKGFSSNMMGNTRLVMD